MTPYYADPWLTVYQGDARAVLAELPAESVHCVVTSPPYWGLRDYGTPGQLGLEPTPEAYVESLVAVFQEVRRVLRADGTVWLNLGDSYSPDHAQKRNAGWKGEGPSGNSGIHSRITGSRARDTRGTVPGLKPKDLVGVPWRVAFALQADGWYLRSDVIWSKPNPMPESVTDRPTKSHEYLFLLSKSARYYFDADAVRETAVIPYDPDFVSPTRDWRTSGWPTDEAGRAVGTGNPVQAVRPQAPAAGRNLRSVWTVATQPYPGAHFATFPRKLVEPCIKAGTSERGVCPECGAPWERVTRVDYDAKGRTTNGPRSLANRDITPGFAQRLEKRTETTGWRPTCAHTAAPVPSTVLDCFAGSGTTGLVAQSLSRRAVLIDLSMDYLGQLMDRNRDVPLGLGA